MIRFFSALVLTAAMAVPAQALTVNGIDVADSAKFGDQQLVLNGAGVRSKFFVDAYIAALYLPAKSADAKAVIEGDEAMAIRLQITSGMINSKRMSDSTRDGFVRSTGGNLAPIEKEVDLLISAFKDEIKEGDIFDLVYSPEQGVTVSHNGVQKSQVQGFEFKKALFGIWLSDDSIQKSLRKAMLNN